MSNKKDIRVVAVPENVLLMVEIYSNNNFGYANPCAFSFKIPVKRAKVLIKQLKQIHKENV